MPARRNTFSMDHPIVLTFLIFAVIGFMSLAAEVLKPLALSILFCFALTPLSRVLERRGISRVPATVLTVVLSLGLLGVTAYVVEGQLVSLANKLPEYEDQILKKISVLKPKQETALDRVNNVAEKVASTLDTPVIKRDIQEVRIVSQPSYRERLEGAIGPYLESLAIGSFVLIIVLFMMINREDLRERMVQLLGHGRISLTTKTMDEIGSRVSRYLAMFAAVNTTFGIIIGLGMWAIGVPYAVLWGFLAGSFRFIPYVGAAIAFTLPVVFSIAHFEGWFQPLAVVALFGLLEVAANSFLEPIIYGKTTGVSALGLIVAAMFWTWLWGGLGLLLSTPLTVCLAVLGKYVPGLGFFATFLREEAEIDPTVRLYQRFLAMDQDGATALVEAELKQKPRAVVFDQILIPTLSMAERDANRQEIDERQRELIWQTFSALLDDLEETPELDLETLASSGEPTAQARGKVVAIPANDRADLLVVRMLQILLKSSNVPFETLEPSDTPYSHASKIEGSDAAAILISHLPPDGLASARYLTRRLHARFDGLPLVVGDWTEAELSDELKGRFTEVGAKAVVGNLVDAREQIRELVFPKTATPVETRPSESLGLAVSGKA